MNEAAAAGHAAEALLADGVILLGAAIACVLLFRRLGLGAVLGYLVAGAAIGPQGLRLVGNAPAIQQIGEIGIVLLLFLVGLELHPQRLWRLRRDIFGFGTAQVVCAGLAAAALVWLIGKVSWSAALALGLPLALSSTAQVLPMLRSAGRMHTPFGERTFSILLLQDLSIVPLITIIASLSRAPATDTPPGWQLGLFTVGAVIGLVLAGRFILNPLFRLIGHLGEREMFVAAGLFTVLAVSAVMQALHLSTALGAFIAGVMLADSPYRHELEADVEPFRSILLGLFFVSVGMMLDLHAIAARPFFVVGVAAALVAVKTLVLFGLARAFGMPRRPALAMGLLLSQGGEFAFVLFAQAQAALLIAPEAASLFGAVVTLSMATTPFLMAIARRYNREGKGPERDDLEKPDQAMPAAAIIVGYGRFGQTVAQMLMAKSITVTLIDLDVEMIDVSATFGSKVYYGDGTRVDLLRQAGAEEARVIVFATDDAELDADRLRPIADAFPHAALFVRAFDRRQLLKLKGVDLSGTIREVFESAVVFGRRALAAAGIDEEEIARVEREYRRRDLMRLKEQHRSGDIRAAREKIFSPDRSIDEGDGRDGQEARA